MVPISKRLSQTSHAGTALNVLTFKYADNMTYTVVKQLPSLLKKVF